MIYIDPPFGTGKEQISHGMSYLDSKELPLGQIISEIYRILKSSGTLYLHLDWRLVHHARWLCDLQFGEANFLNEIIWSYNYGGRAKDRFPAKHDNILVYAKCAGHHIFNYEDIPRIPYKAPEMQYVGRSKEEAEARIALGQVPTDVWDIPIIGTNSKERTGYPTQKPTKILERIILASSPPNGLVLDCFAGSGTTGEVAYNLGRKVILVDNNSEAIQIMKKRFEKYLVLYE